MFGVTIPVCGCKLPKLRMPGGRRAYSRLQPFRHAALNLTTAAVSGPLPHTSGARGSKLRRYYNDP